MKPINLLLIPIGGGVLFVAACVLEFIISGVLGFVVFQDTGFGVPFRFFALGLPMLSSGYFSAAKLFLDWSETKCEKHLAFSSSS